VPLHIRFVLTHGEVEIVPCPVAMAFPFTYRAKLPLALFTTSVNGSTPLAVFNVPEKITEVLLEVTDVTTSG
jgi:hypothetical protein